MITNEKKAEIWNHIILLPSEDRPKGVTNDKLDLIKNDIWNWDNFWMDIVQAHNLLERHPIELKKIEKNIYNHCIKKFWEMIVQVMVKKDLLKV